MIFKEKRTSMKKSDFLLRSVIIKSFFIVLSLSLPLLSFAQWKFGITGGAAYNSYSIDTHYMDGWHFSSLLGGTAGFMGQYDIKEWIAIRTDLNWTMKNHRQKHLVTDENGDLFTTTSYYTYNHYIQLPIMASLNTGSRNIRGFINLGGYGGYWLSSYLDFKENNYYYIPGITMEYKDNSEKYTFDTNRDQRYDLGLVGGVGVEFRFPFKKPSWAVQIESRYYYSLTSTQKDYMRIKDPKYNTTLVFQVAFYIIL